MNKIKPIYNINPLFGVNPEWFNPEWFNPEWFNPEWFNPLATRHKTELMDNAIKPYSIGEFLKLETI